MGAGGAPAPATVCATGGGAETSVTGRKDEKMMEARTGVEASTTSEERERRELGGGWGLVGGGLAEGVML